MNQTHFIIEKTEEKNAFMRLYYFSEEVYQNINAEQEWTPMKRLLVDSDQKHIIYVMEIADKWEYIRFPENQWPSLDEALVKDQDLMLVISKTESGEVHKSILLKNFQKEMKDLVQNMKENANYGEEVEQLVEKYFSKTLASIA